MIILYLWPHRLLLWRMLWYHKASTGTLVLVEATAGDGPLTWRPEGEFMYFWSGKQACIMPVCTGDEGYSQKLCVRGKFVVIVFVKGNLLKLQYQEENVTWKLHSYLCLQRYHSEMTTNTGIISPKAMKSLLGIPLHLKNIILQTQNFSWKCQLHQNLHWKKHQE